MLGASVGGKTAPVETMTDNLAVGVDEDNDLRVVSAFPRNPLCTSRLGRVWSQAGLWRRESRSDGGNSMVLEGATAGSPAFSQNRPTV